MYSRVEPQYVSKSWRQGYGYLTYADGYNYRSTEGLKEQWIEDNGTWFYLDGNGSVLSEVQELDGAKYYFNTHGEWLEPGTEEYTTYMGYVEEIYSAYATCNTSYVFRKDGWYMDDYLNLLGIINDIKFDNIVDNTFDLGVSYENDSIVILDNSYTRQNRIYYERAKSFIGDIITAVNNLHTDEQKVAYINDTIVSTFDYDWQLRDTGSGYLEAYRLGDKIVCSGYATIFSDLCKRAGLESEVIIGETAAGVPHAWNYVRVDGRTKYIDVCWNDTSGNNRYVFLVPLREIREDHIAYKN